MRPCTSIPLVSARRRFSWLASDFLHNYIFLAVGRVGSQSTDLIMQHVEFVAPGNDKRQVLLDLINTVEVRAPCAAV